MRIVALPIEYHGCGVPLGVASLLSAHPLAMAGGACAVDEGSDGRYAATLAGVRDAAARIAGHAHVTPVRCPPRDPNRQCCCALDTLGLYDRVSV